MVGDLLAEGHVGGVRRVVDVRGAGPGAVLVGHRRGDGRGVREVAEGSADAREAVLVDRARGRGDVGDLEGRPQRVGLDVEGVGRVEAQRGAAQERERVAEADHAAVAHRGHGADTGVRHVAVGDRGGDVAAGDHGLGGGLAGTGATDAAAGERTGGEVALVVLGGVAVGLVQASLRDTGDAHRHRQGGEALGGLGAADVAAARDGPRGLPVDLDVLLGARGAASGEVVVHLGERGHAGDGRGSPAQAVGHGAEQLAVDVDRRAGHALPDAAGALQGGALELDHDHVEADGDPVVEDPDDLAGELLGGGAGLDGQSRHGVAALELRDVVRRRAVGCRLGGAGRTPGHGERAEREPGSNGGGQGPSPARLDRTRHRAVSSLDVRARSAPAAHGDVSGATLVAGHEGSCLDRLVTVAVRCLAAACPVPVRWLPGLGRPRAGGCAGRT